MASKNPLKSTFLRVYVSLHCPKVAWLLKLPFTGTELSCNDWEIALNNS